MADVLFYAICSWTYSGCDSKSYSKVSRKTYKDKQKMGLNDNHYSCYRIYRAYNIWSSDIAWTGYCGIYELYADNDYKCRT